QRLGHRAAADKRSTVLEADRVVIPPLEADHDPRTVAWWEAWRSSPMADQFTVNDLQRLVMLIELVDRYWAEPKATVLAEIRLNESALGATVLDRRRLGVTVKTP